MSDRRGFRRALRALILVRLREFFREPEAVFWVYIFPILLATGLGIAFRTQPPERIRIGWATWGVPADSLLRGLVADTSLEVERFADSTASALALRNGRIALLAIPESHGVRYRYDDTRPEAAQARLVVDGALQRSAGRRDPMLTRNDPVRERGSRYIDFLLPGLLGLNLMGSGIWGTGFAIVSARKQKLLKRLVATPMSRADYLASFPLAQLLLLVLEMGTILGFGVLAFDVPVRGSLGAVAVVCALGSLTFGAMGLLAAARPTTIEGISGLANLMMMPMWVLSGVFFSSARFPEVVRPIIRALPLTLVVDALRAIMLEGATLAAVSGRLLILLGWMVAAFVVALRIFRWQ